MGRVLTAILSFHWMAVFAVAAASAVTAPARGWLPPAGSPAGWDPGVTLAICLGNGLVAVLFLWTLLGALIDDAFPGESEDVARMAFGAAVVMMTAGLFAGGMAPVAERASGTAVQLAALMATYLVIHFDRRSGTRAPASERVSGARATARLMALRAAHGAVLGRSAGPGVPANDEGRR